MVKEYHDELLHLIVECKTGNENLDRSIENAILGYVNLALYCLETDKFDQLITKTREIAVNFKTKGLNNK